MRCTRRLFAVGESHGDLNTVLCCFQLRTLMTANGVRLHGGAGGWHKASVFVCLPLAAPLGLSPLLILTLCGSERVLVVSLGGGGGGRCPVGGRGRSPRRNRGLTPCAATGGTSFRKALGGLRTVDGRGFGGAVPGIW